MEVRYLVENWNIYDAHNFKRSLLKKCSSESTALCLHTRFRVNKKFPNSHYFFKINIKFCLLCSHLVMTSTFLLSRRPNCQSKACYAFGSYVSADFFFRILRSWKARFHIAPFRTTRYVLKRFRYLVVRNRVRNWNKVKNSYSCGRNFNYTNWKYQYSYTK